jgi:RimJ/RimL family protein N-acetyltransferase
MNRSRTDRRFHLLAMLASEYWHQGAAMLIGRTVSLRPPVSGDATLLSDWHNDPEYLGRFYNVWPTTPEGWVSSISQSQGAGQKAMYLIIDQDGSPVGTIGYFDPFTHDIFRGYEIWYQVHPTQRKKGIATEAARLLIDHLFNATSIERIQATSVVGNVASDRVLKKIGMTREGEYRRVSFLHGEFVDMTLYSIVRPDWVNAHQSSGQP